jgi:GT2 family glycosyltransferase
MSTEKAAGSGALVSIICRTIGRDELTKALASISTQTHSNIELVLVNSAGKNLDQFDLSQLNDQVVNSPQQLSRSQAANAGLDAASGSFLMFLDDDDWIANDHVENLLAALGTSITAKAAYSSTVKTLADGSLTDEIFERDFDPKLLMHDNYIPIHAVLFSKELLNNGCRFDEAFNILEDWDFWLQLSQHTEFIHVNKVSAFYRGGGDSDTATDDDKVKFQSEHLIGKARAALFSKWKERWDGNDINLMLGSISRFDLSDELNTTSDRLKEEFKKNDLLDGQVHQLDGQVHQLNEKLTGKDRIIQEKNQKNYQLQAHVTHTENKLSNKTEVVKHLQTHITQLESALHQILGSTTWRLMGPLRRIGRMIGLSPAPTRQDSQVAALDTTENSDLDSIPAKEIESSTSLKESDKAGYDRKAQQTLESFLQSGDRLSFTKQDQPTISIILVLYNQAHLSLLCLQSLIAYGDVPFELIIVDNGSSDSSKDLLAAIDNSSIQSNENNLGFVEAVNQGAAQAKGEYVLLLNNDAVIHQQTLSAALSSIHEQESVGAVGGKISLLDGSLQEAGSIIWNDGSCLGYGRGDDPLAGNYMFKRNVDYCSGAFLLFRRKHFEELNGFDLDYAPAYYEESDFCIRLQKKGLRIVYNPAAEITHYEFASSGGISGASKLQQEHQQVLCTKHSDWLSNQRQNDAANIQKARSANNFPNVLLIDDRVPHPSLGSGYPRSAHLLNSIDKLNLNITFYPLQFPIDDWKETYTTLSSSIEVILEQGRGGLYSFLDSRKNFYQFIIVSRVHNMEYFKEIAETNPKLIEGSKIIYDAEALTAPREILHRQLLHLSASEQEVEDLIAEEMKQAAIADEVIAVSAAEADVYREHGIDDISVLGHTLSATPGEKSFANREGMLFVGALRDEGSPNVDSLLWFVMNILPIIEQSIPEIKLYVVGDNSASSLAAIEKQNVSFLGRLGSIESIYNNCRVFIAPTRFAAGIPHKVHEAASKGIPCVTTPLLANQLQWQHEKELLVGEDAEGFAEQCIRLYLDEALWQSVRDAELSAIAKDCSDSIFQSNLKALFD